MPDLQAPEPEKRAASGVLCPYCGTVSEEPARCSACKGNFDPLSRQATQNSMGPWFIRDALGPHKPGCSFAVIHGLALRERIEPGTVIRGPTTNQFWAPARRVPGVANLIGLCHNCGGPAGPDDAACMNCGATFQFHEDRQHLGLTEVRLLPGQASPEVVAAGPAASAPARIVRPIEPRRSVAAPSAAEHSAGGVPKWVVGLAILAVGGAVFAAAWIMDAVPGMPSPVREATSELAAESPAAGGRATAEAAGESAVEAEPEAPDASPVESVPPEPAPDPAEADIDQARRLMEVGSVAALTEAIGLLKPGTGEEGALREAAMRRLEQLGLEPLP